MRGAISTDTRRNCYFLVFSAAMHSYAGGFSSFGCRVELMVSKKSKCDRPRVRTQSLGRGESLGVEISHIAHGKMVGFRCQRLVMHSTPGEVADKLKKFGICMNIHMIGFEFQPNLKAGRERL